MGDTDLIQPEVVSLVKKKHTFKRVEKIKQITNFIVKDLQKLEVIRINDIGTVQRCCELIENMVKKKDKIDKFEVICKVFTILCNLQQSEIPNLKNTVQFLLDSKSIRKVRFYRKIYSYARKVFVSNFLFREQ